MLALNEFPAEVSKPTYGDEMHGDERVPLVSVYLTIGVGALDLELIKRGLCDALFEKVSENDSRAFVGPYARRFPTMNPVRLEDEFPGYRLTVHGDLADVTQTWADVEVAKIEIDPKEGGGASVKFRAQMRGERLEPWVALMHREVNVTLEPPKPIPLPEGHPDAADDGEATGALPGTEPDDDPFAGSDLARGAEAQPEPIAKRGRRARAEPAATAAD